MMPPLCEPIEQIKHPICFAGSTSTKSQLHINHNLDTFLWWIFRLAIAINYTITQQSGLPAEQKKQKLDWESIRSSPPDIIFDRQVGWTILDHFCSLNSPSCFDDVLAEDGELHHVLPLAVHLKFFLMDK